MVKKTIAKKPNKKNVKHPLTLLRFCLFFVIAPAVMAGFLYLLANGEANAYKDADFGQALGAGIIAYFIEWLMIVPLAGGTIIGLIYTLKKDRHKLINYLVILIIPVIIASIFGAQQIAQHNFVTQPDYLRYSQNSNTCDIYDSVALDNEPLFDASSYTEAQQNTYALQMQNLNTRYDSLKKALGEPGVSGPCGGSYSNLMTDAQEKELVDVNNSYVSLMNDAHVLWQTLNIKAETLYFVKRANQIESISSSTEAYDYILTYVSDKSLWKPSLDCQSIQGYCVVKWINQTTSESLSSSFYALRLAGDIPNATDY